MEQLIADSKAITDDFFDSPRKSTGGTKPRGRDDGKIKKKRRKMLHTAGEMETGGRYISRGE